MMDSANAPNDLRDQFISKSGELVKWLQAHASNCTIRNERKFQLASRAFSVALAHHRSIVLLASNGCWASASALVRLMYEAYVRGCWLAYGASPADVKSFEKDVEFEKPCGPMIQDIEGQLKIDESVLTEIKSEAWSGMCDYVHTGIGLLSRYDKGHREPNLTAREALQLLNYANWVGSSVGRTVLSVSGSPTPLESVDKKLKEYLDQFEAIAHSLPSES